MIRTLAIVGNPNCGKTTIFNGLTGGSHRVGNWPGVTVEKRSGMIALHAPSLRMVLGRAGEADDASTPEAPAPTLPGHPELIDLPGIYSLNATSEDEVVARDVLLSGEYDLILNVIDAGNLERNLFLTLQLIEMHVPLIVVLNMVDIATSNGISIHAERLSHHLGCPVVPIAASRRAGVETLRDALSQHLGDPVVSPARVSYPEAVAARVAVWRRVIEAQSTPLGIHPEYAALRLVEGDDWISGLVARQGAIAVGDIAEVRAELAAALGEELDIVVADARYGFIHSATRDVMRRTASRQSVTERIDRVVMNRWLGIPIFLGAMFIVFWGTVAFGGAFIDFFDVVFGLIFVDGSRALLSVVGAPGWLTGVVAGGIGAGIQTVGTFVPIIFMMFFMLSLLEDSGYMARAAFVMDRLMRWLGLPGKSFVPLLVGFGCTVPAISATRTLESRKDRYTTVFMAPFMSCGARLPVYALFAAALFPGRAGLVVFSLYLIGLVLAVATGLLLKHTIFRGDYSHFVMELPPYHAPRMTSILRLSWRRLKEFIKRAGVTITLAVAILAVFNSIGTDGTFGNENSDTSVLASVGRAITPVFAPMGIERDNWPATVGLFTGMFAKEAIVGTLSALYTQNDNASEAPGGGFNVLEGLQEAVATIPAAFASLGRSLGDPLGTRIVRLESDDTLFGDLRSRFSGSAAFAYLVFVLVYFPCIAALGAAMQEMGPMSGILMASYLTVLAYLLAVLSFQLSTGGTLVAIAWVVGGLAAIVALFALIGRVHGGPTDGQGALVR